MSPEQSLWFERVAPRYAEPQRFYHTTSHLRAVLTLLLHWSRERGFADIPPALFFAALYHDAVYDPRLSDNEEMSANLCRDDLRSDKIDSSIIERACALILSTRSHSPVDDRSDAISLLDADLWILGASPDEYERYAARIRQEYSHVPLDAYRAGRTAILERFLARPRLYFGSASRTQLRAERARRNLRAEIDRLRM